MKNSRAIGAVNKKRKLTRSEMHRDQKPRDRIPFNPLIIWAKCFPQGFTALVSRWLSWPHTGCWSSKWSMWWIPSSDLPYSKQPSARRCYTADPISVLLFLSLMSSPFCATKIQLSILEADFSVPYPPSHFYLIGFSQATGHGENWGEGLDISHLILLVCCQGVKKMAGSLPSCCHHILWKKKWFCHSKHTAAGKKRCWHGQSIFFFSADLKEVRHKGPKGYKDYGISHCQKSQSIPHPDAVPHHQDSILVSCG